MLLEISFIFLSQDCFGYLGSFEIPHEFQNFFFYFCKKTTKNHWDFDRDFTDSEIALTSIDILLISLPIHEY